MGPVLAVNLIQIQVFWVNFSISVFYLIQPFSAALTKKLYNIKN